MIPPCRFYEMHPDGEQYVGRCRHPVEEHRETACIWWDIFEGCDLAEEAV